jgi:hypothetical protein
MSARHLKMLERRRDFLANRIASYTGESDSYDKAEHAALVWALSCCRLWMQQTTEEEMEDEYGR